MAPPGGRNPFWDKNGSMLKRADVCPLFFGALGEFLGVFLGVFRACEREGIFRGSDREVLVFVSDGPLSFNSERKGGKNAGKNYVFAFPHAL